MYLSVFNKIRIYLGLIIIGDVFFDFFVFELVYYF